MSTTGSGGKDNRHRNTTCVVSSLLYASIRPSFLSRFISACLYNGTSIHLLLRRRQTPQVTPHPTQYANVAAFLYFRGFGFTYSALLAFSNFHVSHFHPRSFVPHFHVSQFHVPHFSAPPFLLVLYSNVQVENRFRTRVCRLM